jgi:hypothetical protein
MLPVSVELYARGGFDTLAVVALLMASMVKAALLRPPASVPWTHPRSGLA